MGRRSRQLHRAWHIPGPTQRRTCYISILLRLLLLHHQDEQIRQVVVLLTLFLIFLASFFNVEPLTLLYHWWRKCVNVLGLLHLSLKNGTSICNMTLSFL